MRHPSAQMSRQKSILVLLASLAVTAVLIPVFRLQEASYSWPLAVVASIIFVWPGVLFGWAVWRRLVRQGRVAPLGRALALHAVTALVFSVAWTLVFVGSVYVFRPEVILPYLREGA
jgi:hypothetical protein